MIANAQASGTETAPQMNAPKGHSLTKKVEILRGRNMSRNVLVNSGSLRFVQNISVDPHVFQADEPSKNGGKDAGPDPFELVLAALGACASITVQMYANIKQWPVEGVHVVLSYVKVPAEDRTNSDTKIEMVDGIEMGISFDGDLSEDQQRRLLEIAGKCPIHRLLTSPVPIQTKLLVPSSLSM
jgi:putative redox protein